MVCPNCKNENPPNITHCQPLLPKKQALHDIIAETLVIKNRGTED